MGKNRRRRGVFFISALFLTTLVAMFVGAAFDLGIWGMKRSGHQGDVAAARLAAESGVEYALARLRNDPTWRAQGARTTVVQTDFLTVVEEQGNVVGLLRNAQGESQFRIRFNYHDGAGGGDNLPNPSSGMLIDSPLVSHNNLLSPAEFEVFRGDGPGFSVTPTSALQARLPGRSVLLAVEGRAGSMLRTASETNPNPAGLDLSKATVETVLKVSNLANVTPAVASSAQDFEAELATLDDKHALKLDSADSAAIGRLRSRENLEISGGKPGEKNLVGKKGEYRALGTADARAEASIVNTAELPGDNLYAIEWDDVRKATPTASNQLPAGVYAVEAGGVCRYYDMPLAEYRARVNSTLNPLGPGTIVNSSHLPASVTYSSSDRKMTVLSDTSIAATANTAEFAFIPKKGVDVGNGASFSSNVSPSDFLSLLSSYYQSSTSSYFFPNLGGLEVSSFLDGSSPLLSAFGMLPAPPLVTEPGGVRLQLSSSVVTPLASVLAGIVNSHLSDPGIAQLASYLGGNFGAQAENLSPVSGVSDPTRAQDLRLEVSPNKAASAVLSAPGNVVIGARLKGEGASITTEGNLSLVGVGIEFSALSSPTEGISLYSKRNLLMSTLDSHNNEYKDIAIKGVLYAWGDIRAVLGDSTVPQDEWGKFKLTGAMVAYGKDPSQPAAPATRGRVNLVAREIGMKFDSSYIYGVVDSLPANPSFARVRWSAH